MAAAFQAAQIMLAVLSNRDLQIVACCGLPISPKLWIARLAAQASFFYAGMMLTGKTRWQVSTCLV